MFHLPEQKLLNSFLLKHISFLIYSMTANNRSGEHSEEAPEDILPEIDNINIQDGLDPADAGMGSVLYMQLNRFNL